ncbi:MAG: 50S ribosomal protein L25 [Bacteroidetes bacterium]|nr:50S ribosomal protein L25 [Bacteroidota bacterium]
MEIIALTGLVKEGSGKEVSRKLRNEGLIPAVMYKSGGGDSKAFGLESTAIRHLIYTSKFKMAEITLDGQVHKCIVKDIQFHPVNDQVIHLDFLELVPGVKFKATVPLRFVGQAPGVKSGGKFLAKMRQVNILTTPEYIVDEMDADISGMELGGTLRIRDVKVPEGVEVTNQPAVPIASIEIPRALRGK